jgi:hypothetical protein
MANHNITYKTTTHPPLYGLKHQMASLTRQELLDITPWNPHIPDMRQFRCFSELWTERFQWHTSRLGVFCTKTRNWVAATNWENVPFHVWAAFIDNYTYCGENGFVLSYTIAMPLSSTQPQALRSVFATFRMADRRPSFATVVRHAVSPSMNSGLLDTRMEILMDNAFS